MTNEENQIKTWIDSMLLSQVISILGQEYKINKRFRAVVDGMNQNYERMKKEWNR